MNDSVVRYYDPEQLRTFLAVAQALSFTQAAHQLGLRQPTVSQQIRRLEDAVGRELFVRDTRSVSLTADGEALAGFARSILAAHEQAASYFTGSGLSGRLRLGVTDDLALTQIPRILREFRQLYPRIDLELTVAQTTVLQRRVQSNHLDLAFVKTVAGPVAPLGSLVRRDRLVWAGIQASTVAPDEPIRLVVYQAPSESRSVAVQALERDNRAYRITCTVRGVNGIIAAVRAGLGLAVMARTLMPGDFLELPAAAGLPELGEMDLVLLRSARAASEPVDALTRAILASGRPLAAAPETRAILDR
ncbi:MAG TPA: LysR substrate-binding domain-containing protein [Jatrophihabitans sp.]|nr:LysR substrate-binding domain-containing protein [Jatrophihabitans sp.]